MKRPIAALDLPDVAPGRPETPPPVVMMVRPSELLVDDAYQRDLSDASIRLIRRILAGFDWRKFRPPSVAMTPEGPVVIDGQHTAIAAATHPAIAEIPVLVVEAPEQRDQAQAFVGLNTARLGVTAAQLHHANAAAGDKTALAVNEAVARAGVRLLKNPPSNGRSFEPRESIAISTVAALVGRRGADQAARILSVLADLEYGPITANQIRAVDALLTDPEYGELDPEELPRIITALGLEPAEKEAARFAATHGVPRWRGLAAVLFKARKGKRKPPEPVRVERLIEADPPPGFTRPDLASENAARHVDRNGREFADSPAKRDTRPARNGWTPGPIMRRCASCQGKFVGGLKASNCADCAYGKAA